MKGDEKVPEIFLDLKYENAGNIIEVCRSFEPYFNIDLKHGVHVIDAFSWLGVFGMINHRVQVVPVSNGNPEDIKAAIKLYEELKPYGAFLKGDN